MMQRSVESITLHFLFPFTTSADGFDLESEPEISEQEIY